MTVLMATASPLPKFSAPWGALQAKCDGSAGHLAHGQRLSTSVINQEKNI